MSDELKVGDVVVLLSGGPEMTIDGQAAQGGRGREFFHCAWFYDGRACTGEFASDILRLASEPPTKVVSVPESMAFAGGRLVDDKKFQSLLTAARGACEKFSSSDANGCLHSRYVVEAAPAFERLDELQEALDRFEE